MKPLEANNHLAKLQEMFNSVKERVASSFEADSTRFNEYGRKISQAFNRTMVFHAMKDGELDELKQIVQHDETHRAILNEWIEDAKQLTTYNPLNAFVALRLYERKRIEIRGRYSLIRSDIRTLRREYGNLAERIQSYTGPVYRHIRSVIDKRNDFLRELERIIEFPEFSFVQLIEVWFTSHRMKKSAVPLAD